MADAKATEYIIFVAFIFIYCHDGIIPSPRSAVLSLVRVFWAPCCNVEMETVDWRGESPPWSQLSVILHPITILQLTSNYPSPQRTRFLDSLNTVCNYHQLSDSSRTYWQHFPIQTEVFWKTLNCKDESWFNCSLSIFLHIKNILGFWVWVLNINWNVSRIFKF